MDEAHIIRQMSCSDLDELMEIERLCFTVPWSRSMLENELFNNRAWYRVAAIGGRIAGYAGMWKILDEGHITNIAVHPDFRRRGLGAVLLGDLVEHAGSCGINDLTLEVRVSNEPAIRLYESFGFIEGGRRKSYYSDNREDALIMWLNIQKPGSRGKSGAGGAGKK